MGDNPQLPLFGEFPKVKRREMRLFDDTQVHKLLITAQDKEDQYLALYKLATTTGMRQGELLSL